MVQITNEKNQFALLVISIVVFITYFIDKADGVVQCYVCSWQKPSGKLDMKDNCTHYNFKPEYASTVNCTEGCEAISYRHSKNDEVYHFSRNCFNSRKGLTPDDKCYAIEEKIEYLNVCECHSNLCNSAQSPFKVANSCAWSAIPLILLIIRSQTN